MSPDAAVYSARQRTAHILLLAVSYFVFGHASFLVQVDDVLVTPVLFAPEGIALAMALRFGTGVWPGVFIGQLALALSRGLAPIPSVSISAINSVEAVLAVLLFRALKLDAGLPRARDLTGLLLLIFFVLQPFSATLGSATLWACGIVSPAQLATSWFNWWIGNSFGQMLVAPLLLTLFGSERSKQQTVGDFLVPVLVIAPAFWAAEHILRWAGVSSLVVVFAPILVLLAIYRGLVAVCIAGLLIAVGALYATSHAFGPFVSNDQADIPSLNLFIIGLTLSGQFLAVFLRQLSRQRETEAELSSAKAKLQQVAFELTENIPVGTYTMVQPPDGGMAYFSFMSARFLELTGLDRDEAKSDPMKAFACVHPEDHAEWVRKNAYVFEHKLPFREECRIVVDGKTRWIRAESTPRDLPDGSIVWEGVLTDITEQREAEHNLSEANRSMRLAAAAARLGFWDLDVKTGLDHWDEEMARINGVALAEFDGRWEKFVHPEDYEEVMCETRRMLESDRIFEMEYRIVQPSGAVRHIREHGIVVRDEEGKPLRASGVLQDITEQKTASAREKDLEAQHRRDLESKLKTSLAAAAVAHEINQPLSAILLRTKMALQEKRDGLEVLSEVAEEAQRVVTTIEKMKTLMRSVQTEHRGIDLSAVVRSALLYNKTMLSRHDITVRESGLDKARMIMGDDAQLQLAITNILRNAAEAIDQSAAERREISIDLSGNKDEVILTIGDSGPGWSGAELAEAPLTTTKKGGTGIGLYVARTAMENHRGKISFGKSALGGAEVKMIFPRDAAGS